MLRKGTGTDTQHHHCLPGKRNRKHAPDKDSSATNSNAKEKSKTVTNSSPAIIINKDSTEQTVAQEHTANGFVVIQNSSENQNNSPTNKDNFNSGETTTTRNNNNQQTSVNNNQTSHIQAFKVSCNNSNNNNKELTSESPKSRHDKGQAATRDDQIDLPDIQCEIVECTPEEQWKRSDTQSSDKCNDTIQNSISKDSATVVGEEESEEVQKEAFDTIMEDLNGDETVKVQTSSQVTRKISVHILQRKNSEYKDAFSLFDRNNDGSITSSELGDVMKSLGVIATEEEVNDVIHDFDLQDNGVITYDEFTEMMTKKLSDDEYDQQIQAAFKVFDQDGNGYITATELKTVMAQLGERMTDREVMDLIRQNDMDGDSQIDIQEFEKMMSSKD